MNVTVQSGDIAVWRGDGIVVSAFEGVRKPDGAAATVDRLLKGQLTKLLSKGDWTGKLGQTLMFYTLDRMKAERVCVVGLGKPEDFTLDRVRQAAAFGAKALRQAGSKKIATVVPGLGAGSIDAESAGQATAEGLVLGLWRFRKYRTDGNSENEKTEITDATLVERDAGKLDALKRGAARGKIFAEATNLARELANEPSNNLTPTRLANIARSMAREHKLEFHVIDRVKAKRLGMGAFLGVAQGSEEPPAMIVLRYWGAGKEAEPGLGLIGKGITFDSGGISLKPGEGMQDMKGDMSGGAAVIAAMQAIAQLKPKINVTGIVAATENMPSGKAYKPGDILKAMNGKTIEVANTDAEGRLILADAVAYASGTLKLSPVVDAATLTGAIATALGNVRTGLFSNDDELAKTLGEIGEQTGEKMWRMPMDDEYAEMIKSDWADVRNIGTSRQAGAIIGAWFIRKFVAEKTPWAHLDIAGAANLGQGKDQGYVNKWGTGVPTRTFIELALRLASQK